MIINLLCGLILTTFISVSGNVQAVEVDSPEYQAYQESVTTDIGTLDNLETALSAGEETEETEDTLPTVSGGDSVVTYNDNTEVVALLAEQVELLAENSSSVTGTINSSVLNLMDRMLDDYPSYYKYAGFRIDSDDSYRTTLYIAKHATAENNVITFSEDCVAINFYRYTATGVSSYVYYDVTPSPNATVDVNTRSIVYTNVLDGYPSLGTKVTIPEEYVWIVIFAIIAIVIFVRRNNNA